MGEKREQILGGREGSGSPGATGFRVCGAAFQ